MGAVNLFLSLILGEKMVIKLTLVLTGGGSFGFAKETAESFSDVSSSLLVPLTLLLRNACLDVISP